MCRKLQHQLYIHFLLCMRLSTHPVPNNIIFLPEMEVYKAIKNNPKNSICWINFNLCGIRIFLLMGNKLLQSYGRRQVNSFVKSNGEKMILKRSGLLSVSLCTIKTSQESGYIIRTMNMHYILMRVWRWRWVSAKVMVRWWHKNGNLWCSI